MDTWSKCENQRNNASKKPHKTIFIILAKRRHKGPKDEKKGDKLNFMKSKSSCLSKRTEKKVKGKLQGVERKNQRNGNNERPFTLPISHHPPLQETSRRCIPSLRWEQSVTSSELQPEGAPDSQAPGKVASPGNLFPVRGAAF